MNWIEKLATYFTSKGALYIVSDGYGLLEDQMVQDKLLQQGCVIQAYEDPVIFRYEYETSFRHINRENRPIWIVTISTGQFNQLPYDVLSDANKLTLSWETLFPFLDATVVNYCSKDALRILDNVASSNLKSLHYNESIDFILKSVYQLDASYLLNDISIVKAAIRYYEQFDEGLPTLFLNRLKQNIQKTTPLLSADLLHIFQSFTHLTQLLNEHWAQYVRNYIKHSQGESTEVSSYYNSSYFDDLYIQRHVKSLITPISVTNDIRVEEWMQAGLLMEELPPINENELFNQDFNSFSRQDWGKFANQLGQLQIDFLKNGIISNEWKRRVAAVNTFFETWMFQNYSSLRTLPVVPKPKMVHQIPHFLTRKIDKKIALLVFDGMNFTQWHMIKQHLSQSGWSFEEDAVFTWIPSVTSVARQSIFSGLEPKEFADTIYTTRKEKSYWIQFWEQAGFSKQHITYEKSLGLKAYNKHSLAYMQFPSIRIYGAVVDVIDQFMHGATQGSQTVISELSTWLKNRYIDYLLTDLAEEGFEIYITSDHGNIEGYGLGRITEGVTVESKGERARIYQSEIIRNHTFSDYQLNTLIWDNQGLPHNFHVLLAKNNLAFVPKSDKIVTHGGIHLEEVIVPFVKVIR
ncbi:BREX-3 system phosphatase PglZ [Bacillus megaterium]|uniref:BREX-3 system phosphatase PglZ n=1 Tax=Priestia megaterium TaxID=1404 RepID=UPI001293F56D|nr:BREX-3 system phosphatase PglZ [Priestia megaterium]MQR86864.1 BREX-3 system phosphatase PglZ [Priestia megaterium]